MNPLPEALLAWYDAHRRDLPWRATRNPYAVWVSEIMLQQTQVATVLPFWHRWMERFPDVESLAEANEQELLGLWQGLGYYRRCRLLHEGARFVAEHGMPRTAAHWLRVPGVGAYTAGAIASIAFDEPAALVDGNVERVYARMTADDRVGSDLHRAAWDWARSNLCRDRPGTWNQALMELGATVCTPVRPACGACPVSGSCVAFERGEVDLLPVRMKAPRPAELTHVVWIPRIEESLGVRQIPHGSWWAGMWEFPRVEAPVAGGLFDSLEVPALREVVGPGVVGFLGEVKHTVTNHRITLRVHSVRCETRSSALTWLTRSALADLPMPSPQRKALKLV